jgi:probable lipoprotein NlpC
MSACRSSKTAKSGADHDKENKAKLSTEKKIKVVIQSAKKYIGTPYKYAGMDKEGIDCSGLICVVFNEVGMEMPRQSHEQCKVGTEVEFDKLRPGDLVFTGASKGSKKISHVGLVSNVENGKIMFIHASTQKGVIEENLLDKWYKSLFLKAIRIF